VGALGGFTPQAFRVAWLLQYPLWAVAVTGLLLSRRRVAEHDVVPPEPFPSGGPRRAVHQRGSVG
jgi:hypothetical protein